MFWIGWIRIERTISFSKCILTKDLADLFLVSRAERSPVIFFVQWIILSLFRYLLGCFCCTFARYFLITPLLLNSLLELIVPFWREMQQTIDDFKPPFRNKFPVIGRAKHFVCFFLYLARRTNIVSKHHARSLSVIKTDKKLIGHFMKDSACWEPIRIKYLISKILSDNSVTAADVTRGDNKGSCS